MQWDINLSTSAQAQHNWRKNTFDYLSSIICMIKLLPHFKTWPNKLLTFTMSLNISCCQPGTYAYSFLCQQQSSTQEHVGKYVDLSKRLFQVFSKKCMIFRYTNANANALCRRKTKLYEKLIAFRECKICVSLATHLTCAKKRRAGPDTCCQTLHWSKV